jgi:ubiquinone/menaquinone biosynthesis C-methylase UbiE
MGSIDPFLPQGPQTLAIFSCNICGEEFEITYDDNHNNIPTINEHAKKHIKSITEGEVMTYKEKYPGTPIPDNWNGYYYANNSNVQWHRARMAIDTLSFQGTEDVLDIGCGNGKITFSFSSKVPNGKILGIDISETMLKEAHKGLEKEKVDSNCNNITFKKANILTFNSEKKFDLITCFSTIHWIQNQQTVLKNINKLLKPNGKILIIAAFTKTSAVSLAFKNLENDKQWKKTIAKRNAIFHPKTPKEYETMLHNAGFTNFKIEVKHVAPFFKTFDNLVGWLMGFVPHCTQLSQKKNLEFCIALAKDIYKQNNIDTNEPIHMPLPYCLITTKNTCDKI